MSLNKPIVCVIIFNMFAIACQNQVAKSSSNNQNIDIIQNNMNISIISSFDFEYGRLNMINTFQKDSVFDENNPFVRDLYRGFSVEYDDSVYNNVIGIDCPDCESYFGVYKGDSIDNIEGFNPLVVENETDCFLIMEGYYYGCNGSFCNFGSILILKFKEKKIQKIYLFGMDKTIYSLNRVEANILEEGNLYFRMYSDNNDSLDLILNDKIEFKNKEIKYCELTGIVCIR